MAEEEKIPEQNTKKDEVDEPASSQEIIESTETQSEISDIQNMEVHKHPHHVTHKKKWTEYLLEFFMLFLAVFLGFIAENIRETNVEHEREKEYAAELYKEL